MSSAATGVTEDVPQLVTYSKDQTDPDVEALRVSPIFIDAKSSLDGFKDLRAILDSPQPEIIQKLDIDFTSTRLIIEEAQARFKAWGSNIAAFHNGTFRTSLDFRLAEAPAMKRRTMQVLEDLQEYLEEITLIISGCKNNEIWSYEDSSDSSDYSEEVDEQGGSKARRGEASKDAGPRSNLDALLKAIIASNASLMKLSIVIRSSATRDDYLKAASRYKTWNPYADIGHVKEKHGSAKYATDWLLERLGKAITRRRQFLRYRIEHNDKMSGMMDEEDVNREKPEKTIASTKATTFIEENILQNVRPPGSDAGNSFGSQTSYEPTVYQGEDETAPRKLTVPPPPRFAFPDVRFEYGEPFKCPYCFTEQVVKNKAAWKKHVFRDLKPYVCTFRECELLMFRSRNEWFAHELQNHRREWTCHFCLHASFPTLATFSRHIKSAHPNVLSSSPLDALVMQSEEPVDKIPSTACKLCNVWEADLIRKQASRSATLPLIDTAEDGTAYTKPKLFRRHLGRHMEQLALFALPSNDTEELDDDSSDENGPEPDLAQGQVLAVEDDESTDEADEDEPRQMLGMADTDLISERLNKLTSPNLAPDDLGSNSEDENGSHVRESPRRRGFQYIQPRYVPDVLSRQDSEHDPVAAAYQAGVIDAKDESVRLNVDRRSSEDDAKWDNHKEFAAKIMQAARRKIPDTGSYLARSAGREARDVLYHEEADNDDADNNKEDNREIRMPPVGKSPQPSIYREHRDPLEPVFEPYPRYHVAQSERSESNGNVEYGELHKLADLTHDSHPLRGAINSTDAVESGESNSSGSFWPGMLQQQAATAKVRMQQKLFSAIDKVKDVRGRQRAHTPQEKAEALKIRAAPQMDFPEIPGEYRLSVALDRVEKLDSSNFATEFSEKKDAQYESDNGSPGVASLSPKTLGGPSHDYEAYRKTSGIPQGFTTNTSGVEPYSEYRPSGSHPLSFMPSYVESATTRNETQEMHNEVSQRLREKIIGEESSAERKVRERRGKQNQQRLDEELRDSGINERQVSALMEKGDDDAIDNMRPRELAEHLVGLSMELENGRQSQAQSPKRLPGEGNQFRDL